MEKSGILTQSTQVIERLRRHRWSIGLAGSISALGMAAAMAVAPNSNEAANVRTVTERLAIEGTQPLPLGDAAFLKEERVQRGDTVGNLLARLGIQDPEALEFIRTSSETRVMHQQLAPGKTVVAQTSQDGELKTLYFPLNGKDSVLMVERLNGRFAAKERALRYETQTIMRTAEIKNSLFGAADTAGVPDSIATELAEIFGGDIDFHRDLRKDDRFTVIYEMLYLNGQAARSGRILAAEFINNSKSYRAIRFDQDGRTGYYTPDGRSLRKAFLRSPLEFSRITSGFAMRFHPILQQWRAHKGIDYGAPSGAHVRSTADGVVEFVGQHGGYGNLLIIKHSGNYSTAYGHLQGFASGIRKGARINQGQTVGFVGQTGWATGPHLHYEFRINSQQVNPLAFNLPVSLPLEAGQLAQFKAYASSLTVNLDLLRDIHLSAQD